MKERIEAAHGTLEVVFRLNQGVRLVCRIPVLKQRAQKEIRILITEDQQLIAESLVLLLNMEKDIHVIGVAQNGNQVVEYCENDTPDLI